MEENTTTPEKDDDLRSSLEAAYEEKADLEPESQETVDQNPSEPQNQEKSTDEGHKDESLNEELTKNTQKLGNEGEKKPFVEVKKPNQPPKQEESLEERTYSTEKPPVGWKPAVREHWESLPDDVKQEVVRREREIDDRLRETKNERQFAHQVMETLQPYQAFIKADQVSPMQAIDNMMSTVAMLRTGTADQIAQVLSEVTQKYGIGRFGKEFVGKLDSALSGQVPKPEDEQKNQFRQEIQKELQPIKEFQQQFTQRQQQQMQQKEQEAYQYLHNFAQEHEYFQDVAEDISAILEAAQQRGKQITLEQAYDMACNINPEIKPLIEKKRQSETAKSQNEVAQKAKRASVGIRGSAPVDSAQQSGGGSLRDDLEFALSQMSR